MAASTSSRVRINAQRLMTTLHDTCAVGTGHRYGPGLTETGMKRLALSDADKEIRLWLRSELEKVDCRVEVDQMGNMFGRRKGKREGRMVAMGSHLDTQPTGGRYDGILGIMAALEGLRAMKEEGFETEYPVGLVNWTNEEGARFPKSVHGSAVWAGNLSLVKAYDLRDVADPSVSAGAELERIGFKGQLPCSWEANPLAAHFELHIEQGPILEQAQQKIGVVQGGQAYKWFNVTITGQDSHAGCTPLESRSDALLLAAGFIESAHRLAGRRGGLATIGIIHAGPGSINTICNKVTLTLDVRHHDDAVLEDMARAILRSLYSSKGQPGRKGCSVEWNEIFHSPYVPFDPACQAVIRQAAEEVVGADKVRSIVSGAGHDTCSTAKRCPSGMVFVPSRDGLSHNPKEFTTDQDCALGAQVLVDAVLLYDQQRKE